MIATRLANAVMAGLVTVGPIASFNLEHFPINLYHTRMQRRNFQLRSG
jgi:hypothetical protein